MVTYMNDKKIRNLDDVRVFLAGSAAMEFSITDKEERYRWIEQMLRRFQYRKLGRVERISERFLIPVLAAILDTFPFVIQGFHADNGSEYINRRVADLLNKLNIKFTKSRQRHPQAPGL